jgi:hypothetical protein
VPRRQVVRHHVQGPEQHQVGDQAATQSPSEGRTTQDRQVDQRCRRRALAPHERDGRERSARECCRTGAANACAEREKQKQTRGGECEQDGTQPVRALDRPPRAAPRQQQPAEHQPDRSGGEVHEEARSGVEVAPEAGQRQRHDARIELPHERPDAHGRHHV